MSAPVVDVAWTAERAALGAPIPVRDVEPAGLVVLYAAIISDADQVAAGADRLSRDWRRRTQVTPDGRLIPSAGGPL